MACLCGGHEVPVLKRQPLNPIQASQKFAVDFVENGKRSANAAFASCAEALVKAAASVSTHIPQHKHQVNGIRLRKGDLSPSTRSPHDHLKASWEGVVAFSQALLQKESSRDGQTPTEKFLSPLCGFASLGSVAAAHAMGPAGLQFVPSSGEAQASKSSHEVAVASKSVKTKAVQVTREMGEPPSLTPSSNPQASPANASAAAALSKPRRERPSWVKYPPKQSVELAEEIAMSASIGWSGFIRPVDKVWEVSSSFGPRWGRNHNGVDLAAPCGEPILAADAGEVTFAGWEPTGYGNLVEITHKDGWRTLYAHASDMYVYAGQEVRRGECIASVGETGRATGPHLHWEIRNSDNVPVDPATYIKL